VQAIAQLALVFPSLLASTIIEALCNAGGDIQRTADALLTTGYHHS
jgi:hypothetical protein